jgi:hypothetical protein
LENQLTLKLLLIVHVDLVGVQTQQSFPYFLSLIPAGVSLEKVT